MKMAFNGGCDTDGPHNKRLCTGQNIVSVNDNNNNTNGGGLISNGTVNDVDMKGLGLLRVNFDSISTLPQQKKFHTIKKLMRNSDWIPHLTSPIPFPLFVFVLNAAYNHFRMKLNLIASLIYDLLSDDFLYRLVASSIIQFVII